MTNVERYEKKFVVTVGHFASEKSAIDRAELCKRNGIMAEIIPINGSPIENLTAAVLLIADKLSGIEEMISKPRPLQNEERKPPKTLAEYVKQKRLDKGLTQKQLTELCGICPTYLSNIECGVWSPTRITPVLRLIASSLDFPVENFDRFLSKRQTKKDRAPAKENAVNGESPNPIIPKQD